MDTQVRELTASDSTVKPIKLMMVMAMCGTERRLAITVEKPRPRMETEGKDGQDGQP